MKLRTLLAVVLLGAVSATAGGQRTATAAGAKGFFLGVGLNGSNISADDLDDEDESGGGLLLQLGWGFNPQLALFLEGNAAAMQSDDEDSWLLSHGDVGLRYHFAAAGRRFIPFVDGAFTALSGLQDDAQLGSQTGELEITGSGFTVGGGFLYLFSPRVALNLQLKVTKAEFNEVRFENVSVEGFDIDATSARFNIGVSWFLGGGR